MPTPPASPRRPRTAPATGRCRRDGSPASRRGGSSDCKHRRRRLHRASAPMPATTRCAPPACSGRRAPIWPAAGSTRCQPQLRAAARNPRDLLRPDRGAPARHRRAERRRSAPRLTADEWTTLATQPDVRRAAALAEIGEYGLADEMLRWQAQDRRRRPTTMRAAPSRRAARPARDADLARAQLPDRRRSSRSSARYPAPNWVPQGGWQVDKALVFAHTLQELRFRTDAVSPAGARGLMERDARHRRPDRAPARRRAGRIARRSPRRRSTWATARPICESLRDAARHRRAAAQGDRRLQCRPERGRALEQRRRAPTPIRCSTSRASPMPRRAATSRRCCATTGCISGSRASRRVSLAALAQGHGRASRRSRRRARRPRRGRGTPRSARRPRSGTDRR